MSKLNNTVSMHFLCFHLGVYIYYSIYYSRNRTEDAFKRHGVEWIA